MMVHISHIPQKKCWNPYDTYGMICVHCGCCSESVTVRRKARLEVAKRHLQGCLDFSAWDSDAEWRAIQEKNIKTDIRYWRRMVRYYEAALDRTEKGKTE